MISPNTKTKQPESGDLYDAITQCGLWSGVGIPKAETKAGKG